MDFKPQSDAQRKLIDAAKRAAVDLPAHLPPALFLTDPDRTPDPASIANRLPRKWGIIYRHFGSANRYEIAENLAKIARIRGLTLLIAADPELAQSVGARGVHWPHRLIDDSKHWRDAFPVMTTSAHSPAELETASAKNIDAVLLSTVFASSSPSAGQPLGAIYFNKLRQTTPKPVYALGGVDSETAADIAPAPFASISGIADAFAPKT
jgi:thiamine-phosphate pyrophosphorylase